ncbi:MAG: outer membrane beta-barrel protein, partial [Sediminibacterium sp.]
SAGAFGTSINSNTLSLNYKIKKITIIPELRMEKAKDKIFYSNEGTAVNQSLSFNIAAIYKF